jgi:hypothetical protein
MSGAIPPAVPQHVLDAADVVAVTQLCLAERESRDLGRWDRMRACFWPESRVRISWFNGSGPDFVDGSIDMAKRGVLASHRLGPPAVRLCGDRATAAFIGAIDIPAVVKGIDCYLSSYARFLYRAERRTDRWGLMMFEAIYMRDELAPAVPGQSLVIGPDEVKGFRRSYRMLSYLLSAQGYRVNHELPGEDRPETVKAILDETDAWLAGT